MPRKCLRCRKTLVRRPGEHPTNFKRRTHCNRSCACVVGFRMKGKTRPKIEVPCTGRCGTMLLRAAHIVDAKCTKCKQTVSNGNWRVRTKRVREEARRYRVLMTALGFDSFDELVTYLHSVPWAFLDGKRVRDLRGAA